VSGSFCGWDPPDGTSGWSDFHRWKVPGGRILQLIILSSAPVGYSGHFSKGRMHPCYGEGCQLCHDGVGAQVRYMFGGVEPTTRRIGIWDVGRSVALDIKAASEATGLLRGLWWEVSHMSSARQSRTQISVVERDPPSWFCDCRDPDRLRALLETWRKAGYPIPDGMEPKAARKAGPNTVHAKSMSSLYRVPPPVR